MSKYARVFLKGEPMRWFDMPLDTGSSFHAFCAQMRFEGFVMSNTGFIVYDQVRAVMLIETTQPSSFGLGTQTVGQA